MSSNNTDRPLFVHDDRGIDYESQDSYVPSFIEDIKNINPLVAVTETSTFSQKPMYLSDLVYGFDEGQKWYYSHLYADEQNNEYNQDNESDEWEYEPDYPSHDSLAQPQSTDREKLLREVLEHPRDAIYKADETIFDKAFVEQALRYNPLSFGALPEELQQSPNVLDIYREVLYAGGYQKHPAMDADLQLFTDNLVSEYQSKYPGESWFDIVNDNEFQEEYDREKPHHNIYFGLHPEVSLDKMCSAKGYEQAFSYVLSDPAKHSFGLSQTERLSSSHSMEFLAKCRKAFPGRAAEYDAAERNAYEAVKDVVQNKLANSTDYKMKIFMAEFCCQKGLEPMPAWRNEYEAYKAHPHRDRLIEKAEHMAIQQECRAELQSVKENMSRPNYFALDDVDSVLSAMTNLPLNEVTANLNLQEYWEQVGMELHPYQEEARLNMHNEHVRQAQDIVNTVSATIRHANPPCMNDIFISLNQGHDRAERQQEKDDRTL